MIPFGNTTITIYNKYQYKNASGKLMTIWKRTIIPNCGKIYKSLQSSSSGLQLATTQMMIQIPYTPNYVDEYEWDNLLNEEMTSKFTVQVGDLVVTREVADEIDEFSVIEDIEKKYGSISFKISQVNKNYGKGYPLQHIQAVE